MHNDAEHIIQRLIHIMRAPRGTSAFFVNGLPGSGKSYLLRQIEDQIPKALPRILPLGPYLATKQEEISQLILKDCYEAALLKDTPPNDLFDFSSVWNWISSHINATENQSLLVLIDVPTVVHSTSDAITLFSAVRALESTREERRFGLHFVLAGTWNHSALEAHFDRTNISFPYTVGDNYCVWLGISALDMTKLIPKIEHSSLWGNLLHELTGGHPSITLEIMTAAKKDKLTLTRLIDTTYEVAKDGLTTQKLFTVWHDLPKEAIRLINTMLFKKHVKISPASKYADDLLTLGIAQRISVGEFTYLEFRSWYVELVIRFHLNELGLSNLTKDSLSLDYLIPPLVTFNQEAFRLICDIESSARHLISNYLLHNRSNDDHILKGRVKNHEGSGIFKDLYDRASEWRMRSANDGLMVRHNPLITYSTTRELAELIKEIGYELKQNDWIEIGDSVRKLATVRDLVMHNQLIEYDTLERLYVLEARIFRLLDADI